MSDGGTSVHAEPQPGMGAERIKAFIDAVVAIAMTLLILPLMDSVGETASAGEDTAHWLSENTDRLTSFLISFVVIAMFWSIHHHLFVGVERVTTVLLWITFGWMATIVWLPVATALTGQVADDPLQKVLYIGSMTLTSLVTLGIRGYLMRHPDLHTMTTNQLLRGIAVDLAMTFLWGLALFIAIVLPAVGYYALFVMMFTGLLQRVFSRMMHADTEQKR